MALDVADLQLESRWRSEAQARGVTLDVVLSEALTLYRRAAEWHSQAEATDRLLDEAADIIPAHVPPIPSQALRREHLYE